MDTRATEPRHTPMPVLLGLGIVTCFFDTLGIGSFATQTMAMVLGRMVHGDDIPGTLNVGDAIPVLTEALIYSILFVGLINWPTMFSMVIAAGIGAWFGSGIVVRWSRRLIQRAMAIALLITAGFMAMQMLTSLSVEAGIAGLTGMALVIGVAASLIIGSLTSLGIGNYAPTLAVTYMLGMDTKIVFPIMAASSAVMLPIAAIRFYRSGRFSRRVALGITLGGVPGVLIAAFLVKALPLTVVKWVVVVVLLYTAAALWRSSRRA